MLWPDRYAPTRVLAFVVSLALLAALPRPLTAQEQAQEQSKQSAASTGAASLADVLSVAVENASEPVLCAEKDNVTLLFRNDEVRRFRIEAAHPAYIDTIAKDSWEADWTACDFAGEALAQKPPQRTTIYEDIELWVVAHRNESFWREADTKVRIGDKVYEGLHLLQVWMIRPMGGEEVLVIYPQDGYWRLRPKAPDGRAPTAFGSSVLIGPVTQDQGRPVVEIEEIAFDPQARRFTLSYAGGNRAIVSLVGVTNEAHTLDVAFDRTIEGQPFAAMRSMYITRFNNDVAEIAVQEDGATGWREEPVMQFSGSATARQIWAGRHAVSRHNTSSPDMVFRDFSPDAAR